MINTNDLDVLVVYSATVAQSASVSQAQSTTPFLFGSNQDAYNLTYAYFLSECKKQGLKAGFASSVDVIGPGRCKHYWTYSRGQWKKHSHEATADHIFDKLSPVNVVRSAQRELLLSDTDIQPFNDVGLFKTFFDKLRTYKKLPTYTIPTVGIQSSSLVQIQKSIQNLKELIHAHAHSIDFSNDFVLKDRFGAGGNFVYKINAKGAVRIASIMQKFPRRRFVLQPFLRFDEGYAYKNNVTATDIRLIFHHNLLLQSYIRMAKPHDFRCNVHQGGQIVYVKPDEVPEILASFSEQILAEINKPHSLFALDFAISNSGNTYLIEGNIGPGINWSPLDKMDERKAKQLIQSIVLELATRVTQTKASHRYQLEDDQFDLRIQPAIFS
jgi:hypothetical protein